MSSWVFRIGTCGVRAAELGASLGHNKDGTCPVPDRACPRIVGNCDAFRSDRFCKSRADRSTSMQSTDLIADNSGRFFAKSPDFSRDISTVTRDPERGRGADRLSAAQLRGAFATNSAATGSTGTKNGPAYSAEAILEPGCTLRFASRNSASAQDQERRPRIGSDSRRACPAQKNKARLKAAGLTHPAP